MLWVQVSLEETFFFKDTSMLILYKDTECQICVIYKNLQCFVCKQWRIYMDKFRMPPELLTPISMPFSTIFVVPLWFSFENECLLQIL